MQRANDSRNSCLAGIIRLQNSRAGVQIYCVGFTRTPIDEGLVHHQVLNSGTNFERMIEEAIEGRSFRDGMMKSHWNGSTRAELCLCLAALSQPGYDLTKRTRVCEGSGKRTGETKARPTDSQTQLFKPINKRANQILHHLRLIDLHYSDCITS
jgi:hypothetical protein